MQTLFGTKKTPVTTLALAIGLALQLQPAATHAQQAGTAASAATPQDAAAAAAPAAAQQSAPKELDTVVVTGTYRASLEQALDIKRSEKGMVDAIVAEDIADFPDLNLAESLQRIPGVAISRDAGEGRNISVRGLGADFTRVRIDGMEALTTVGSTDSSGGTNRGRGFDFNVFASELFSQLIVRKTASAEVEEGSLGATVDLRTARPFDYDGFNFVASGQLGYNDLNSDTHPRAAMLVSNSWADDRFGALFSVAWTDRNMAEEGSGSGRWASGTSNGGFDESSPYTPALDSANFHPRIPRYSLMHHEQERIGLTGALQFKPSENTDLNLDLLYARISATRTEDYIEAISFSRGGGGKQDTVVLDGALDDRNNLVYGRFDNVDIRSESRIDLWDTKFTQIGLDGEHRFSDSFRMTGLIGRSRSAHQNPVQTTVIMDKLDVDGYSYDYRGNDRLPVFNYGINPTDPNGWTLAEIRLRPQWVENTYETGQLNFDWDMTSVFRLKGGVAAKEYKFSTEEGRRITGEGEVPEIDAATLASLTKLVSVYDVDATPGTWVVPNVDGFAGMFNIYANNGMFEVASRPVNDREVTEKSKSIWVQGEFNTEIGSMPFSGNIGVRHVKTDLNTQGYATVTGAPVLAVVERDYSDTLPSMNLVAELTPELLLRFGAAKVMARPGLGFLTPGVTVNVAGGARTVTGGNPNLEPFRAKTYDLGLEWYFDEGALLGLALFYKDIDSYVQNTRETRIYADSGLPASLLDGTGATPQDEFVFTVPLNTPGGPLQGIEANYQQPFTFLPGKWSNFGVQLNYTYIDSDIQYLTSTGALSLQRPMIGLSKNAYNGTLYYEGERFSGRVSVANRSDYLTTVPGRDGNDVEGTAGPTTVDASLSWKVDDHWELSLEGLNLTDEWNDEWLDSIGDRTSVYNHTGRQYFVGVRFKL
ncbi:TonB-dependent receptor [Luteimonas cucumeris]|uniref:TonB-dependent receptor n=1 Tax=Luteimonas cucumeris TaxID=985012 RepID=A0A562LDR2_9GAMM|nr:TonB-dependent receptor [Luteimonas cucumeris]TWI05783.1 TonB-dependent receptor [Luteimonas cucumeris]